MLLESKQYTSEDRLCHIELRMRAICIRSLFIEITKSSSLKS